MKGPFPSYQAAREAAAPGDVIMARTETAETYGATWCLMGDMEATLAINSWFSHWVHWENVREEEYS